MTKRFSIRNINNNPANDYNYENFGQPVDYRTYNPSTHNLPTEHSTTLNNNNNSPNNPNIPYHKSLFAPHHRKNSYRRVGPANQTAKNNANTRTQKQNWVDKKSQELISARADLLSAFSTLKNLVRFNKGRGSRGKTKKNMSPPEITISKNMDSLTTIIANLDEMIPPVTEETQSQQNNNVLYNNNNSSSNA